MQLETIEDLNDFLETRNFSFQDISEMVYVLLFRSFEFNNSLINRFRRFSEKKIIQEMNYFSQNKMIEEQKKFEIELKSNKLEENNLSRNSCLGFKKKCNINWPLCIYDKFFKLNIINYFYFRISEKVNIIEDYFYSLKNNQKSKDKLSNKTIYDSDEFICEKIKIDMTKKFEDEFGLKPEIQINLGNSLIKYNDSIKSEKIISKKNIVHCDFTTPIKKKKNFGYNNMEENSNIIFNTDEKIKIINEKNLQNFTFKLEDEDNIVIESELVPSENEALFELENDCFFSLKDEEEENSENQIFEYDENILNNSLVDENNSHTKNFNLEEIKYKKNKVVENNEDKDCLENNINLSLKKSHSNKNLKSEGIKKENKKRMEIYKSLLINRRVHYCEIVKNNEIQNDIFNRKEKINDDIGKILFFLC